MEVKDVRHSRLSIIVVILSLSFRSVSGDTNGTEEIMSAEVLPSAGEPVDLNDIGFHGSWDRFCNVDEMEKDYANKPGQEIGTLRNLICELADDRKIDAATRPLFAAYKYCVKVRPRVDKLITQLVIRLSQNDEVLKSRILNTTSPSDNTSTCYQQTIFEVDKRCIARENPYYSLFTKILSRSCAIRWLTTEDIISYIQKICVGERISGGINWQAVIGLPNS